MIDNIYCISLKDNNIRRNLMIQQLEKYYPKKYKIVDACTLDDKKVSNTYNNLFIKKSNIDAMSQIAICHSHIKCLKKIVSKKYSFGGIIEDDIRIDPDIKNKLDLYIKNTPGLLDCMKNEPCIIHICGPSHFINRDYKFIERGENIIVNICFYVINYRLAQILIDNFYPVRWQFDTYISKILRKLKIKEYTARPILAWDLSSTIYSKFWNNEDIAIRKHISSTSKITKIDKTNIKPNIILGKDPFEYLFAKILNIKKKNAFNICVSASECHHLAATSGLDRMNANTIIAGQGIDDIDQVINHKPFAIIFTRGPLTMDCFKKAHIYCPDIFLEPLLLLKYTEKKNTEYKIKHTKYLIITDFNIDTDKDNRVTYMNINNIDCAKLCQYVQCTDMVISNMYYVLILGNSYGKTTVPINNLGGYSCIKYIDYILGYKNITDNCEPKSLVYYDIKDVCHKIKNNYPIYYPQVDIIELNNKCKQLCDILPYVDITI